MLGHLRGIDLVERETARPNLARSLWQRTRYLVSNWPSKAGMDEAACVFSRTAGAIGTSAGIDAGVTCATATAGRSGCAAGGKSVLDDTAAAEAMASEPSVRVRVVLWHRACWCPFLTFLRLFLDDGVGVAFDPRRARLATVREQQLLELRVLALLFCV